MKRNKMELKKFQSRFSFLKTQGEQRASSILERWMRQISLYSTPTIEMQDENDEKNK